MELAKSGLRFMKSLLLQMAASPSLGHRKVRGVMCGSPDVNYLTIHLLGAKSITFTLPKSIPNGQYLVRIEHIALHSAGSFGGAQTYISCSQINVTGGGSGTPGPLVSIPGVYTGRVSVSTCDKTSLCSDWGMQEPGILINIYYRASISDSDTNWADCSSRFS